MSGIYKNKINNEAEDYDDIVQYEFVTGYYEDTLQTISGLLWVNQFCPDVDYVVVVDGDYILMTYRLLTILERMPKTRNLPIYMGHALTNHRSHRSFLDELYLPHHEYPYDILPIFIDRGRIIMSTDFIKLVINMFPYTKLIKFSNFYIGVILHKLIVQPIDNSDIFYVKVPQTLLCEII